MLGIPFVSKMTLRTVHLSREVNSLRAQHSAASPKLLPNNLEVMLLNIIPVHPSDLMASSRGTQDYTGWSLKMGSEISTEEGADFTEQLSPDANLSHTSASFTTLSPPPWYSRVQTIRHSFEAKLIPSIFSFLTLQCSKTEFHNMGLIWKLV